jgi:hypothetical protein
VSAYAVLILSAKKIPSQTVGSVVCNRLLKGTNMTPTKHNYVFVNVDHQRTPVNLKVGDELVLLRVDLRDRNYLWPLFSMGNFWSVGFNAIGKLPGQPEYTELFEILQVVKKFSPPGERDEDKIVLRFSGKGPGVDLLPEEYIPFTVDD